MAGKPVKLVVFAHTPPPFHGQSYMVEQFLQAAARNDRIQCFHVNARFSDEIGDIGSFALVKIIRLFRYCLQALCLRFRHGADQLFYVPAPAMRSAIIRDWLIMALCRPLFRRRVYYWQAAGLGQWLQQEASGMARFLTRITLGSPDLSIVLSQPGRTDAEALASASVAVIPNGTDDPFPEWERSFSNGDTSADSAVYHVLFMSLCTEEKGLFDTVEAVRKANAQLHRDTSPHRIKLHIAGKFWKTEEEQRLSTLTNTPEWTATDGTRLIEVHGFVREQQKHDLLRLCDCLCFPTYYPAESFGIVLIEALAAGMQIITTRWRAIPELLPPDFDGFVDPRSPDQIATRLLSLIESTKRNEAYRRHYLENYTIERCMERVQSAILQLNN